MIYVPNYLSNVERESGGWPKGITSEQKRWLINFCQEMLLVYGPSDINFIYDQFKYKKDKPNLGALLDYTYAALDRALREVAVQKWVAK